MILSRRAQMLTPRSRTAAFGRAGARESDRDEARDIMEDLVEAEAEESGAEPGPCPFAALDAMWRAEGRLAFVRWSGRDSSLPGIEDDGNGWYTVTGGPHGPFQRYGWAAAADALSAILAEIEGGAP